MTDAARTPESNFADLEDFAYTPNYHQWHDLRMHYIDEGPKDGPVMLLMHGMPTWSYLYRHMIPLLVDAGYRCIAPDHMGFGRSDKPNDVHWFTIARHTEVLTSLIVELDLQDITLLCQDWGGPIGLAQAATMPERFSRLTIMNTWLHHGEYVYSEAIRHWNKNWHAEGLFYREKPDVGILLVLSAGLIGNDVMVPALVFLAHQCGLTRKIVILSGLLCVVVAVDMAADTMLVVAVVTAMCSLSNMQIPRSSNLNIRK